MTKYITRGDAIEPAYINNAVVAARGWGSISGLTVSQRGAGANMSVDVASGQAWINGDFVTKASITNVSITAADSTYDRYDLIVINSSGTISSIDGVAASTSYANDYDFDGNNAILLAEVYVPAADTVITDGQITAKHIQSLFVYGDVAKGIALLDSNAKVPSGSLYVTSNTGSYTGNNTANRAIPHGLSSTPSLIVVQRDDGTVVNVRTFGTDYVCTLEETNEVEFYTVTAPDSTNFYVGSASSYTISCNASAYDYNWVAIV